MNPDDKDQATHDAELAAAIARAHGHFFEQADLIIKSLVKLKRASIMQAAPEFDRLMAMAYIQGLVPELTITAGRGGQFEFELNMINQETRRRWWLVSSFKTFKQDPAVLALVARAKASANGAGDPQCGS